MASITNRERPRTKILGQTLWNTVMIIWEISKPQIQIYWMLWIICIRASVSCINDRTQVQYWSQHTAFFSVGYFSTFNMRKRYVDVKINFSCMNAYVNVWSMCVWCIYVWFIHVWCMLQIMTIGLNLGLGWWKQHNSSLPLNVQHFCFWMHYICINAGGMENFSCLIHFGVWAKWELFLVQQPVWLANVFLLFLICSRSSANKLSYFSLWSAFHIVDRNVSNTFEWDQLCSMIASMCSTLNYKSYTKSTIEIAIFCNAATVSRVNSVEKPDPTFCYMFSIFKCFVCAQFQHDLRYRMVTHKRGKPTQNVKILALFLSFRKLRCRLDPITICQILPNIGSK